MQIDRTRPIAPIALALLTVSAAFLFSAAALAASSDNPRDKLARQAHERCINEAGARPSAEGCTKITVYGRQVFSDDVSITTTLNSYLLDRKKLAELPESIVFSEEATKLPVVMYLHGCSGHEGATLAWRLAHEGYAIIAPNDFYDGRKQRCLKQPQSLYERRTRDMEAVFKSACRTIPWLDCSRSALVGFSEGAVIPAYFGKDIGFRAFVVAGYLCDRTGPHKRLRIPKGRAALTVMGMHDSSYGSERTSKCAEEIARLKSRGWKNVSHIVVENLGHANDQRLANAIIPFLNQHVRDAAAATVAIPVEPTRTQAGSQAVRQDPPKPVTIPQKLPSLRETRGR